MAKNLFLTREQLEKSISPPYKLLNVELKNSQQGFYRYFVEREGTQFSLDIFYTKKNGVTVKSNCSNGNELEQIIQNSVEYKDVRRGEFSTKVDEDYFNGLITFMKTLPSVNVSVPEDKGNHGVIYRISTDFCDSATLTFFKTTGNFKYQGLLMKLYSIIKTYLIPRQNIIIQNEIGEQALESRVEGHISHNFPLSWNQLEETIQGLIRDSFILVEINPKLSDYAAFIMPIIRVLEYRIKKICLDHNAIIEDSKGLKFYTSTGKLDWVFTIDFSTDTVTGVNPQIIMDQSVIDVLVECYDFLRKNRHEMFHATQILAGFSFKGTKDEALQLIIETSEKIEKSVVVQLSPAN